MSEKAFFNATRNPKKMRVGMKFIEANFFLNKVPGWSRIHPWFRKDLSAMNFVPISEDIKLPENTPLPRALVEDFIRTASHRVLFDYCGCRESFECRDYPRDIGCILMGDSALESPKSVSREVGVDEALEHLDRGIASGLVPIIGKARIDNFIFGIKDRGRLLTLCLCCECCCLTRYMRHMPLDVAHNEFEPLSGLTLLVTEACRGCGICAEHCFVKAIETHSERAVIGEKCMGCGRCAVACPNGAIEVSITDPAFLKDAYDRISSHVHHA